MKLYGFFLCFFSFFFYFCVERFDHPRFGKIKCVKTIQAVKAGDELTVAYGYDHNKLDTDAPDWYKTKPVSYTHLTLPTKA